MLFLIILFLLTNATCLNFNDNVGSVLFFKRNAKDCWSQDDVLKLRARLIFENIALPSVPPDKVNAKYNRDTIQYFKKAMRFVESDRDPRSKAILKEALADTIGGHMRKEILPNARFAYYAGYIPYRSVRDLHNFYDSVKVILNTQGVGWKRPKQIPLQSNLTVGKILVGAGKPFDPCSSLVIKRYNRNCIHIPTPIVDNEARPAAVALPFNSGRFVSLTSPSSENILLKYYTTAARCILRSSPEECRHGDFVNFNNELWHWMKKYVAPHLMDEGLYAGYGGVLRIAAAVQNYGKGLSRRNLFEKDFDQGTSWNPMNILDKKMTFNINTSTPMSCVYLVLLAAAAICFLHVCYTWICGPAGGCNCAGRKKIFRPKNKEVGNANLHSMGHANAHSNMNIHFVGNANSHSTGSALHSTLSTMLHPQTVHRCSTETPKRRSFVKYSRSATLGTAQTQRVYDLNENTEKVMSIVMSDKELTETETSTSEDDGTYNQIVLPVCRSPKQQQRSPRSPPKIEASMAQLKIEKTPQKSSTLDRDRPMYSTSTMTQSEMYRFGQMSESGSSGSYSSEHSESSLSTKSQARMMRKVHDRVWAKKASKRDTKSTTIVPSPIRK